jgi:hypothetical protein
LTSIEKALPTSDNNDSIQAPPPDFDSRTFPLSTLSSAQTPCGQPSHTLSIIQSIRTPLESLEALDTNKFALDQRDEAEDSYPHTPVENAHRVALGADHNNHGSTQSESQDQGPSTHLHVFDVDILHHLPPNVGAVVRLLKDYNVRTIVTFAVIPIMLYSNPDASGLDEWLLNKFGQVQLGGHSDQPDSERG